MSIPNFSVLSNCNEKFGMVNSIRLKGNKKITDEKYYLVHDRSADIIVV
jgi:hypothetical protein